MSPFLSFEDMLWGLFVRPSDGKIVEGSRLEAKGGVLGV